MSDRTAAAGKRNTAMWAISGVPIKPRSSPSADEMTCSMRHCTDPEILLLLRARLGVLQAMDQLLQGNKPVYLYHGKHHRSWCKAANPSDTSWLHVQSPAAIATTSIVPDDEGPS